MERLAETVSVFNVYKEGRDIFVALAIQYLYVLLTLFTINLFRKTKPFTDHLDSLYHLHKFLFSTIYAPSIIRLAVAVISTYRFNMSKRRLRSFSQHMQDKKPQQ
jgi:hypothetical protein